ncbi:DsbC domain-containing protein [Caenorhabditis elegans]|uniref:DsbC domain-containing protein n=1 Tax=Caenorhabditis elegans TaxID=6239 RepID=Q9N5H1_CAEEL|nr:DsbC domain-containing protein [Caenorhabditis elegans]CCD72967.2 DsbC domain-containing protein [Caenorhabditis elegans]
MTSSTTILLLLALVGFSSGSYMSQENSAKLAQLHLNMVLLASSSHEYGMLYELIPRGYDIDRFLQDHPNSITKVTVEQMQPREHMMPLASFETVNGQKFYAMFKLTPSSSSPTGYVLSKGFICHSTFCAGEFPSV